MNNKKCPNCGSLAISKINAPLVLALILFLLASVMLWIPVIGWVIAPISLIGSVLCIVAMPFYKKLSYTCKSCKYSWTEEKNKVKQEETELRLKTKEVELEVKTELKVGDSVMFFVEDKVKTGLIASIDPNRHDKYLVILEDEQINNNHMYFSEDEISLASSDL